MAKSAKNKAEATKRLAKTAPRDSGSPKADRRARLRREALETFFAGSNKRRHYS